MASFPTPNYKSFLADADLSSYENCFVKIGTDEKHVNVCDTKGEQAVGVLMNAPSAAGQIAEVAIFGGGALLKLGGTVTAMQQITPNASSVGIIPDAAGQALMAQALDDGVSGDKIAVNITFGEAHAAEA